MYRNLYDSDVTTWSPQGRLHQVEYATEAVTLGTSAIGVRSDSHVVLVGLKRSVSHLAGYNKKLFQVSDHCGITFSGIAADAKFLSEYMRKECLNYSYVYGEDRPHPLLSLVSKIASKSQVNTQKYGRRPYGAGLIIGGVDATGPHLFELSPSGNYSEAYAIAMGGRSQAARSYLEKHFKSFSSCSVDELVHHALLALAACMHNVDNKLTADNVALAIIGKDKGWQEEGLQLEEYMAKLPTQPTAEDAMEDDEAPRTDS